MAIPEYRQGDTWQPLTGTVTDGAGNAVNISTAVGIVMRALLQPGSTLITGATANLDDGTVQNRGKWSYTWGAADLSVVGSYEVQIVVTVAAGKIESYPSNKGRAPTFLVTASN